MPLISSSFKSKILFRNKHLSTIYASLFKSEKIDYQRITLDTPDKDFIDLDTILKGSKQLMIVLHGLEGNSHSSYVSRLVKVVNEDARFDVIVLNHRGCSGRPNKLFGSYHSGQTRDLDLIINTYEKGYESIYIVGFSLGGNVSLKYLGERADNLSTKIKKAVTISVPIDLKGCSIELRKAKNKVYMERFMKTLRKKSIEKINTFQNSTISVLAIKASQSFFDYDELFTAPAHGFKDAEDYWSQNSSKQFLNKITTPTLLLSAQNDPFLSKSCFPYKEAKTNNNLFLETPLHGGHVGFINKDYYWLENRIIAFLSS